jgi:hypothetical protein
MSFYNSSYTGGGYSPSDEQYRYHTPQRVMYRAYESEETKQIKEDKKKLTEHQAALNKLQLLIKLSYIETSENPDIIIDNTIMYIEKLKEKICMYESFLDTLKNAMEDIQTDTVEVSREVIETIIQRTL